MCWSGLLSEDLYWVIDPILGLIWQTYRELSPGGLHLQFSIYTYNLSCKHLVRNIDPAGTFHCYPVIRTCFEMRQFFIGWLTTNLLFRFPCGWELCEKYLIHVIFGYLSYFLFWNTVTVVFFSLFCFYCDWAAMEFLEVPVQKTRNVRFVDLDTDFPPQFSFQKPGGSDGNVSEIGSYFSL